MAQPCTPPSGDTFFLRADEAPTTRLEGVARSVFDFHTVRFD